MIPSPEIKSRYWIAVLGLNNFRDAGLSAAEYKNPKHIAQLFIDCWEQSAKGRKAGAVVCISKNGRYRLYMVCHGTAATWQRIFGLLCFAYVEPLTERKIILTDYLLKYAEESERIIYIQGLDVIWTNNKLEVTLASEH